MELYGQKPRESSANAESQGQLAVWMCWTEAMERVRMARGGGGREKMNVTHQGLRHIRGDT